MSQIDAMKAMDAVLHAAFERIGIADTGTYFAPGGGVGIPCHVYVDRDVQVLGQFNEATARRDEIAICSGPFKAAPKGKIQVALLSGMVETWTLVDPVKDDDSMSRWAVRRG